MRRATNCASLGEKIIELARLSDTPRTITLEQSSARVVADAAMQLADFGVSVTILGKRDKFPVVILKSNRDKFAELKRCVNIPIRTPRMVAGFERAYAHTLYEQWLLSNPLAVHIPKVSERPWREEQPTTADCTIFYPYSDLATREEVKLAPRTIELRAGCETPKPAPNNARHTFKSIEEANRYYATV